MLLHVICLKYILFFYDNNMVIKWIQVKHLKLSEGIKIILYENPDINEHIWNIKKNRFPGID